MTKWLGFLMIMMLLMVVSAVSAQEVTPSPEVEVPIVVEDEGVAVDVVLDYEARATTTLRDAVIAIVVVMGGVGVAISTAIGGIAIILARTSASTTALAIERVYSSVPSYLQSSVASAIGAGVQRLEALAKETPFTWDDVYISKLKEELLPVIVNQIQNELAQATLRGDLNTDEAIPRG